MPVRLFDDTTPEALEVLLQLHREMDPGEKVAQVFEMCEFLEGLQKASVRSMYPDAGEREVFLRVAARRLDRETMIKVYGWDPALHP